MNIETGFADRDLLLNYLRDQLMGPAGGQDEQLDPDDRPYQRYLTGVLYPMPPDEPDITAIEDQPAEDDELVDDSPDPSDDDGEEDPVTLAGQMRPSSVGMSFVVSEWSPVDVELELGRYLRATDQTWQREAVALTGAAAVHLHPTKSTTHSQRVEVLGGHAFVEARWRPHGEGAIVTLVLVNQRRLNERSAVQAEDCLYQVVLRGRPSSGVLRRYPANRHLRSDKETDELDLMYRRVPVFAVGHGAAAEWDTTADPPTYVETSFFPVHVVPDVAFDIPDKDTSVLELRRLAKVVDTPDTVVRQLHQFVNDYRAWTNGVRDTVARSELAPRLQKAAGRLLDRMVSAEGRMRRAVRLIAERPRIRQAFGLANLAMLMQMEHRRSELAGSPHPVAEAPQDVSRDYRNSTGSWRPFQLGFLLLAMEGCVDDCPDRNLVDLIWFPTGGGKTEAYLGLAAFTIIHRRLTSGDEGGGTTVITRYTLRLLTSQQFQRAATMILACDLIRRGRTDELGSRPVSIGLWLGQKNSPNTYAEARKALEKARIGDDPEQGFQIEMCPWCGTRVVPTPDDEHNQWGVEATNNSFRVFCLNQHCPFRDRIPVSSVDEDLYEYPPTMLVGTVDKFAMAAWDEKTGAFFGSGDDPGPSLIIQDEFHLISGPLGTVVGLYEAAFDVLMAHNRANPKIVAATATIRRAREQALGVFGREVALFPPAGVDADNSYFVRTDQNSHGRAYVGVMSQGHTPTTGLVHVAAAQLQASVDLELAPDPADGYWTLLAYHNSLRELGKTVTLAHDDIPERIKIIARTLDQLRSLDDDLIVEMTSNVSAADIPRTLDRLSLPKGDHRAVSFLASTNMISVGVDVSRLGLMTMVGQPKTTAEYIQASSRVGRSNDKPGIVVTLYSPSKPRDRSHYESFVPYHSALYSAVEPTSVTPFSVPARERALHADLVILVRHALRLAQNTDAARFDADDPGLKEIVAELVERAQRADPDESVRVAADIERRIREWTLRVVTVDEENEGALRYRGSGRNHPRLLKGFLDGGAGWPTLHSMRSVDVDVQVRVRGARP